MTVSPAPYLLQYFNRHRLTYNELARRLDYDPGNLYRLLTIEDRSVKAATACKFAQRLGITVEELMGIDRVMVNE